MNLLSVRLCSDIASCLPLWELPAAHQWRDSALLDEATHEHLQRLHCPTPPPAPLWPPGLDPSSLARPLVRSFTRSQLCRLLVHIFCLAHLLVLFLPYFTFSTFFIHNLILSVEASPWHTKLPLSTDFFYSPSYISCPFFSPFFCFILSVSHPTRWFFFSYPPSVRFKFPPFPSPLFISAVKYLNTSVLTRHQCSLQELAGVGGGVGGSDLKVFYVT